MTTESLRSPTVAHLGPSVHAIYLRSPLTYTEQIEHDCVSNNNDGCRIPLILGNILAYKEYLAISYMEIFNIIIWVVFVDNSLWLVSLSILISIMRSMGGKSINWTVYYMYRLIVIVYNTLQWNKYHCWIITNYFTLFNRANLDFCLSLLVGVQKVSCGQNFDSRLRSTYRSAIFRYSRIYCGVGDWEN